MRFLGVAILLLLSWSCGRCDTHQDEEPIEPPQPQQPRDPPPRLDEDTPVARAINRTARHFSAGTLRGDESLTLAWASWRLGPDFVAWAESRPPHPDVIADDDEVTVEFRIWELRTTTPRVPPSAPRPDVPPAQRIHEEIVLPHVRHMLDDVGYAAFCESRSDTERDAFLRRIETPRAGYVVAHQLFALTIAWQNRCLPNEVFVSARDLIARRVLAELLTDNRLWDLNIERMAVLAMAGLTHWIPPERKQLIITSQRPDGLWHTTEVDVGPGRAEAAHTASLAFYVLAAIHQEDPP